MSLANTRANDLLRSNSDSSNPPPAPSAQSSRSGSSGISLAIESMIQLAWCFSTGFQSSLRSNSSVAASHLMPTATSCLFVSFS